MNHQAELFAGIKQVYNSLDAGNMDKLNEIYSDQIRFEDPFRKIVGLAALKAYFKGLYQNLSEARFDFLNETLNDNLIYLEWELHFRHSRLNKGLPIAVQGISKLTFSEKIDTHRDYFDSSQMLYEHIPLLRHPIRWIKQRA